MESANESIVYHTTANAIVLPIFAAIALLTNYVPWMLVYRVKNLAACTLIVTIAISNLVTFINALVWPNNNWDSWFNGVGLCDIEVQIKYPLYTLIATSLCSITRSLARALNTDKATVHESRGMKRRRIMFDVLFCFGIPFLQLALHYIVAVSRFGIYPVYGCITFFDASWPSIVIMYIWPPLYSLLNCYYAVLVILRLRKHRREFAGTLSSNSSSLSPRRFLKLFLMVLVLLVIYLPLTIYYFYVNIPARLYAYSWSVVHAPEAWKPIAYYHTSDQVGSQYDGWAGVGTAFAICLFWGLNRDAVDIYRAGLVKCGFARVWPSLKEPIIRTAHRRGSANSAKSWTSRFDVVGRAMDYFEREGSTKNDAAGMSLGKRIVVAINPRKPSATPSDHIPLSRVHSHTHSTYTISPPISPISPSQQTQITPPPRNPPVGIFSTFRTHMNIPNISMILPSFQRTRLTSVNSTATCDEERESGGSALNGLSHICSSSLSLSRIQDTTNNPTRTKVWSDNKSNINSRDWNGMEDELEVIRSGGKRDIVVIREMQGDN